MPDKTDRKSISEESQKTARDWFIGSVSGGVNPPSSTGDRDPQKRKGGPNDEKDTEEK
jgi:hypothetical protein